MIARILNILFSSSFDTNKNKQKKPGPKKSRFFYANVFFFQKSFLHLHRQSQRLIGSLTYWLERISGSSSIGRAPSFQVGGCGFESRLPLSVQRYALIVRSTTLRGSIRIDRAEHIKRDRKAQLVCNQAF